MRFSEPHYLILLLLLIPIFLFKNEGARLQFSSIHLLKGIMSKHRYFHPRRWLLVLRILALSLLLFSLARPQSGKKYSEIESHGVDIMLAIDTSGSMQALDFKWDGKPVNRLEVIKRVASDFIRSRPSDRIGLVVFGEEAYTQCPLTLDHGVLIDFLKDLTIGMAGDATAIGSGIGTSINRMKDLKSKSKIIVLLTDGSNNAGQVPPIKAAELALQFGIKVYTIGVGTKGQAPYLVDTPFGKRYIYQEVDIDEETLNEIASTTKAHYYRATDTNSLKNIYAEIDHLEKVEIKVKEYTEYEELFYALALPALFLVVLELVLGHTLLRKIP